MLELGVAVLITTMLILAILGVERWLHRLFPKKPEPELLYVNLRGVTGQTPEGEDRQTIIAGLKPHDFLTLTPDPQHPSDPYAVQALTSQGKQIGHLPINCGYRIWELLMETRPVEAIVRDIGMITPNHPQAEVSVKLILPPAVHS